MTDFKPIIKVTSEIYFIDGGLDDIDVLISGLPPGATYFILNPAQDGLVQMADFLSGYSDLAAIHILSHGSQASLNLGSTVLNQASLAENSSELTTIGNALSATGDLLLYGCNVAQGPAGGAFLQQLASLTGADVAASDDPTGSALLGGDWQLERATGQIEAATIGLGGYDRLLYTLIGTSGDDFLDISVGYDIAYGLGGDDTFKIFSNPGNGYLIDENVVIDGGTGVNVLKEMDEGATTNLYKWNISNIQTLKLLDLEGSYISYIHLTAAQLSMLSTLTASSETSVVDLMATEIGGGTYDLRGKSLTGIFNLIGTEGAQVLYAGSTTKYMDGGSGNDTLYANMADTELDGGSGADVMNGGAGNDTLYVDDYGDEAYGGDGNDTFLCRAQGEAVIDGGAGVNVLKLYGYDDGDNYMSGCGLIDTLISNVQILDVSGHKLVFLTPAQLNMFTTLTASTSTSVTEVKAGCCGTYDLRDKALTGIFNLSGRETFDVVFYAGSTTNKLTGSPGSDILNGGAGDETLIGGEGNDILNGGMGIDTADYSDSFSAGYTYPWVTNTDIISSGYTFAWDANSRVTITDIDLDPTEGFPHQANTGTDTLIDIEFAQFSDRTIDLLNDAPTGNVTISGTVTQGQTLTATNTLGDADGLGTISYQWKADDIVINGAMNSTFILTEDQVGKTITVVASYTDGLDTAKSVTSSATSTVVNVNDLPTGSVTISGTPTQGQTLTASNNLADLDGLGTITYSWFASGSASPIGTGSIYTLNHTEVGKTITVSASYTDGFGTSESIFSAPTSLVANVNDTPTGKVTISGIRKQNEMLTATNTLADADGMGEIIYTWYASGSVSAIGTGDTYTLAQSDVGKSITAVASYVDGFGNHETVSSFATATISSNSIIGSGLSSAITAIAQSIPGAVRGAKNFIGNYTVPNQLYGDSGNNYLSKVDGLVSASIYGDAGNDILVASNYGCTLDGGTGADIMVGGAGNDTFFIDNIGDQIFEGPPAGTASVNNSTDTVKSSISYTLGSNLENLNLTSSAAINGTGNELNNILAGNSGNNILDGGLGNDTLTGGLGIDTFKFSTALDGTNNVDTIMDFSAGDIIALDHTIFAALSGGVGSADIRSAAGATTATGTEHLIYNSSSGALYYDVDGVGGSAATLFAYVNDTATTHPTSLTASSFSVS